MTRRIQQVISWQIEIIFTEGTLWYTSNSASLDDALDAAYSAALERGVSRRDVRGLNVTSEVVEMLV